MRKKGYFADKKHRLIAELVGIPILALVIYLMVSSSISSSAEKFKLSKAIENLQTLNNNIHTAYAATPDYSGMDIDSLRETALIPADMLDKDGGVSNAYGGSVFIAPTKYLNVDNGAFAIIYNGLSKKGCVSLLSTPFQLAGLAGVDIKPIETDIPQTAETKYDKSALPMSAELANTLCEAENDPTNAIIWMFY